MIIRSLSMSVTARLAISETRRPPEYPSKSIVRCFMPSTPSNNFVASRWLSTTGSFFSLFAYGMCRTAQSLPSVVT